MKTEKRYCYICQKECEFKVLLNEDATFRGSSHVEARESSHVEARESSHVVARESSHVVAWESSDV